MWRQRVLVCALLIDVLSGRARAQAPVLIGFLDVDTQAYVRRAVEGAAARLTRPGCQDLFEDFIDVSGQRLATTLAMTRRRPADALNRLRFYDDRDAVICRSGETLAFTEIGSQVIRVCGQQFRDRFLRQRSNTEMIIIHEFLHTLGLGENPPSTQEITRQVEVRCGD